MNMVTKLVVNPVFLDKLFVFSNRFDAGRKLGYWLRDQGLNIDLVLAIPSGGVPVGYEVSRILKIGFDIIVCRKIPIPWNKEAGFGAITPDGTYYIDEELASWLRISRDIVSRVIEEQIKEISKRIKLLRGTRDYGIVKGKRVLLVDDGIAAGYTMMAAVLFTKKLGAREIYVAVPTCYLDSAKKVSLEATRTYCLNPRTYTPYAVADAYKKWYDLSLDEVLEILRRAFREGILVYNINSLQH